MAGINEQQIELFKISTISELTGFSPTLLRAWERRYSFLEPKRMPGGHRLFTRDDLKVLSKIRELVDLGLSIGEIANQGRQRLLEGAPAVQPARESWKDEALDLAPLDLPSFRLSRYRGEELAVSLRELNADDLATVVRLYDALKRVFEVWRYMDREAKDVSLLWSLLQEIREGDLPQRVAQLGARADGYSKLTVAALDDTRWGALGPLLSQLSPAFSRDREGLNRAVLLCRDQTKMMRNAFFDLDSPLRSVDEADKAHSIRSIVEKLQGGPLGLETHLAFEGAISSRCLETSALDRVTYDFLRRLEQCRARKPRLWVGPAGDSLIRWAFSYDGDPFPAHVEEDLAALAVGLSVGLNGEAALREGYLGSQGRWAWFHWPRYNVARGIRLCECELD